MSTLTNNHLEIQNDINRMLAQANALIDMLCVDDQYRTIDAATLSNALWLLSDRITDIDHACQQLFKEAA
ncbi:hypothetical protein LRP50_18470 [Enterovibrio sp. ZSDZ42]|uniref:Phage protein n=1 Tax=Enterovibrio gelatinilyticus TaxID=2899819 RepID=A0ABT5R6I6_9GAMM|nr:hypothetical protein [Enterovibrio sp. ZSDZ42]MDD1795117.1 hypothetical protein [Enterovibrio sp. ZSDZ42]